MIRKMFYYFGIAVIVAVMSYGFKPFYYGKANRLNDNKGFHNSFSGLGVTDYVSFKIPFTGKSFTGFKEAIGFKESQGQYKLINSLGYMGKYQFGIEALKAIGVNNTV